MSFISVVVCSEYLSAVSDRRAINVHPDGKLSIKSENTHKMGKLSDCGFIGVVGFIRNAYKFIKESHLTDNILNDRGEIIEEILHKWFNNNICKIEGSDYTIIFGGRTSTNEFKVYTIEGNTKKIEEIKCMNDKFKYGLYHSNQISYKKIKLMFNELCKNYDGTMESMQEIQEKLNDFIADNDTSVNKNKQYFHIKK